MGRNIKSKKPLTSDDVRKGYDRPDIEASNRAGAHFFNWAAQHHPHKVVPWNVVFFGIYGKRKGLKSKEVELLRGKSSAIRAALQEDYERTLLTIKGLGARATVNSDDVVKNAMPGIGRRVRSSIRAISATNELVTVNEITDPAWRKWHQREIRSCVKVLTSPDFLNKLLPPGSDDKE